MSVPQPGLNNRTSPVYSAAVVGGATVINGMFFNRGSAGDYDAWEQLGNPGWAWKDLLPYFKKVGLTLRSPLSLLLMCADKQSETFVPATEMLQSEYSIPYDLGPHGAAGPVQSSFPVFQYPIIS